MDKALTSVLVVDDNVLNRDLLEHRLGQEGYQVAVAESGEQALMLIESQPFDLVMLDYMMPGMNGLEVLKTVRETYSAETLPVIMVTAIDDLDDEESALALGANDYVTKPIDFQLLFALIEKHLERNLEVDAPGGISQTQ
jgi:DNA-binding response OmpR family regulator